MAMPSCLAMVNRVLEECGDLEVVSLNPGNRNSKVALEGMNDAVTDIWGRQRWPWIRQAYNMALVSGQATYALPDRFQWLAEPVRLSSAGSFATLQEFTPETWWQWRMGVPTTAGNPRAFKIEDNTLTMTPAPTAEYVAIYPTLEFAYFKSPPPRRAITDDNNSWDVPDDFYEAMILFGKSRLKQYLQFPDWQADRQEFEGILKGQLATVRQGRAQARVRPATPTVSQW